ncbi:MAG: lipopolysaccharide heptosyltransferase I [Holophagales bacterium]|jgi:lipopolysaccharide heptosyltransferase I|nr:lipopolysaccharide heptosyltransferase I [Holophagales bacterium]MBK9963503.1 lipopolysaccharide heptosyltransferase I [Holophagales bacterium]
MKILLVRLSSFGDIVFTLPLAKALRGGGGRLAWAVEGPLAELVAGAAYVDEVLVATTRSWRKRPFSAGTRTELRTFLSALGAFSPDVVVDAQGLLKSAWITLAARAPRKIGFGFRTATERVNALVTGERVDVPEGTHVVDRGLALAEHLLGRGGFPRTPDVSHLVARPAPEVDEWSAARSARSARPFALLQPFSSRETKEWDAAETALFCRALAAKGLDPVLRWGPGERERAERIVANSGGTASLAPPSPPAASARLASRAALFVGADTGPTHLAAAAGTPTVALYGPTDPERFGPVGPRVRILRDGSGAYNAGLAGLPGLTADAVLSASLALLDERPDAGAPT